MSLEFHVRLAGALLIVLGLAHGMFPRRFQWREEMARVSLLNRQIFYVHCFFIVLVLLLLGVCSTFYTEALLERTAMSRLFLAGVTLFWFCRLLAQFFVYDAALWRGNRLHTVMHLLFSGFWVYLTAVYGWAWRAVGGSF